MTKDSVLLILKSDFLTLQDFGLVKHYLVENHLEFYETIRHKKAKDSYKEVLTYLENN